MDKKFSTKRYQVQVVTLGKWFLKGQFDQEADAQRFLNRQLALGFKARLLK